MDKKKSVALFVSGLLVGSMMLSPAASMAIEAITAQRSNQPVYVDGTRIDDLEMYNINGNNYIKLRDVGKAVNFNVYWDGAVQVRSDEPYTGNAPDDGEASAVQGGGGSASTGITEADARRIALADAGLKEKDVTFPIVKRGTENGVPVYEVEFYCGNTEYEYDISVSTGAILSRSVEVKAHTPSAAAGDIGQEAAIDVALKHAGVTRSQVSNLKAKKDTDDGRLIYEVEFNVGYTEYDYDIDAATGDILSWDKDID